MTQNPKRTGFRLRWGESVEPSQDEEQAAPQAANGAAPAAEAVHTAGPGSTAEATAAPADAPGEAVGQAAEANPFLRDLVGAMRGVAESSREANLAELRTAVEARVEELKAAAAERTEELRRLAEADITGVGEWESAELDRVRREAEQRRDARRAQLERQLADQQAAADRDMESTRRRLADYERELAAFFAELAEIQDPAAFVAAAKRMPRPPDLVASGGPAGTATVTPADAIAQNGTAAPADQPGNPATPEAAASPPANDATLAERLAQLDQRLSTAPATATGTETGSSPAAGTATATAVSGETSTPIVVKGLGSFGAITSFKQALERVDGIHGVTLSLGPTGEFVYRASHDAQFDILEAIRSIEGPGAGIQRSEGSVLVTIERPR